MMLASVLVTENAVVICTAQSSSLPLVNVVQMDLLPVESRPDRSMLRHMGNSQKSDVLVMMKIAEEIPAKKPEE